MKVFVVVGYLEDEIDASVVGVYKTLAGARKVVEVEDDAFNYLDIQHVKLEG